MKKNIMMLFIIAIVLMSTSFNSVHADIGPKPAVKVTIIGVDEDYYFDLLIYWSREITNTNTEPWEYYQDDYPAILESYQDSDGYVSYSLYRTPATIRLSEDSPDGNVFLMNYHAPNQFKIILVMKDNNAVVVSDVIVTNTFEAEITWDLTDINLESDISDIGLLSGNIQGENITSHSWFITALNTLIRVIITAVLELGVLWLFGFRKKSTFIKVGIVNAVTQTLLSIMLISMYLRGGIWNYIFLTVIGEFLVFVVEISIYLFVIDEMSKIKIILYTLAANLLTIIAGVLLISII